MIDPSWLGHYAFGIDDPEDGGRHRLHLWRDEDSETVRYEDLYESRSNHGYDLVYSAGTVVAVSGDSVTVEQTRRTASGWEDTYKQGYDDQAAEPVRGTIRVVRFEEGRPVLQYSGDELVFLCVESPSAAAMFARARAR